MDASLVLFKSNGAHKSFDLPSSVTVIGRRHDCDLRIPLPTVSRRHCELTRNGDTLEIIDLDSKGGTFVNGARVNGQTALKAGDTIKIGPLTFVCRIDGKPEQISAPSKKAAQPKKPAPPEPKDDVLDDSFADLDASDSFIQLDDSDSDLEDLKDL
ncbi:MAG: FHA domain-containing protein [Sedimentisphaerales bacterium]|nr:FHA domain-containing protein [Sedimentisphaerales bacterium]